MSDNSDFSGGSGVQPITDDAKKQHKKDKKKVKERPYTHLGEDFSSTEEDTNTNENKSPVKSKKPKGFMFGSAKKDKDKKSKEAGSGLSTSGHSTASGEKEHKKKDKSKLKLLKSKHADKTVNTEVEDESLPIFGVPLEVAVERDKCHDGIALPAVVRRCIDFIECEGGIMNEGVYRSSGVKSKVTKLKAAFDSGRSHNVDLCHYDFTVVASVLKLFLRELPEPVLTHGLTPRFEEVSASADPQRRIEGMKCLLNELPRCNRLLVQWVFVHMGHIIERERFNKMTLQNVSIVLSPTMGISHRVLNCFFENSHILFDGIQLKRYVPPITSETLNARPLPDTPVAIEEEIKKQDSLLADLHLRISSGAASKKTEEQIWEQQRIVTQLKRHLRISKKSDADPLTDGSFVNQVAALTTVSKYEPIDYEEELIFSLQTPKEVAAAEETKPDMKLGADETDGETNETNIRETGETKIRETNESKIRKTHEIKIRETDASRKEEEGKEEESSPDTADDGLKEHKVTVMVHRSEGGKASSKAPSVDTVDRGEVTLERKSSHVTVICLGEENDNRTEETESTHPKVAFKLPAHGSTADSASSTSLIIIPPGNGGNIPLLPPPPASNKSSRSTNNNNNNGVKSIQIPPILKTNKSHSLPRGFPSSEVSSFFDDDKEMKAANETPSEEEFLELMRLRFENDELTSLKSELERRKKEEHKEIEELKKEIASMQTLYQYRTCSVDSSESSSDEASDKEEEVEELAKTLADLIRENKELEDTRMKLQRKFQDERAACIDLRVQIKVEQEKIRLKSEQQPVV